MAATEQDPTGGASLAEIDRMKAFSDGVFAIVITLLVLELRVPSYEPGELLTGLLHEGSAYLAFVISFGYVGVLWLNHHALLRLLRGTNPALNWINLAILFGVVIIPFPTAVLASAFTDHGDRHDRQAAVALYALAAALMSLPWLVVFGYLRRRPEVYATGVDHAYVRAQARRPITGLVLYGLAGLLGWFVDPMVGLVAIIVMIIYHAVTSEGIRRRRSPARRPG